MTNIQELTKETLEFLVSGSTDFNEAEVCPKMKLFQFTNYIISSLRETENVVLADIGGSDGMRIAIHVRSNPTSRVYIVDPFASISPNTGIRSVRKTFNRGVYFLEDEDCFRPLAFVSLRTNFDVADEVVQAATAKNAFFVALEPTFYSTNGYNFPKSIFLSKLYGALDRPFDMMTRGFNINDYNSRKRFSVIKQLFALDLANTLEEKGYDTSVYKAVRGNPAPPEAEHLVIARKEIK